MPNIPFLIPSVIYLLINVVFVDKYMIRLTEWHYVLDLIYIIAGVILLLGIKWLSQKEYNYRIFLITIGVLYFATMIGIQYSIDPMSLQVDRWSAIHNFLYNLFHSIYPYSAQTHLGGYGSPFPVWQIVHIPFYLIGNVGLSFFAFLAIFLYITARYDSPKIAFMCLLLIALSPAITYEIAVRSDLFTNFLCICTLCQWLRQQSIKLEYNVSLIAIIAGLCASTRLATLIPIGLLYGYSFLHIGIRKQCYFTITFLAIFILTFLPFLLWDFNQLLFFEYNPFILQTRQGSPLILFIFAILAIGLTVIKKDHLQYFYMYAGSLLTILVFITFGGNMITSGNYNLYSSSYDITYLNMALPFYIYSIASFTTNP